MQDETIMLKIKKILDLANNNPNENEALAASLKAQELLVKYNIKMIDIENEDFSVRKIVEQEASLDSASKKWKKFLAPVIANNFYCKILLKGRSGRIFFYGYEKDVEVAKEVFVTLFNLGNKLARKKYYEYKKAGKQTKGVMNAYLYGFVEGVKEALEKQSTALMVVTPKEVEESFEKKLSNLNCKVKRTSLKISTDFEIRKAGRLDGKQAVEARSIEG